MGGLPASRTSSTPRAGSTSAQSDNTRRLRRRRLRQPRLRLHDWPAIPAGRSWSTSASGTGRTPSSSSSPTARRSASRPSRRPSTSPTSLATQGASFESVFTDYTVARLTGNFTIDSIKGLLPVAVSPLRRWARSPARSRPRTSRSATSRRATSHCARRRQRERHRHVLRGEPGAQRGDPRRHQREALLLREHDGRDGSGVLGLRQHRVAHGALEHVQGKRRRLRLAAEPEHGRHRERQGLRDQRHADRRPEHADGRDAAASRDLHGPDGRRSDDRRRAHDLRLRRSDRAGLDRRPHGAADRVLDRRRAAAGIRRHHEPRHLPAPRRQQRRALQAAAVDRQRAPEAGRERPSAHRCSRSSSSPRPERRARPSPAS